ncbi:hypothetical protein TTHERM_00901800 (macronuclear) [Tetrahymena thermophila SB210]|uniref:Uncharacterized protein n=1 Tax=Tetrahymena thermophila (strain SB210) TaxID=312017 RepID=Q24GB9_TETTS|nr:hypothetical protein TTHERM_00901800 [Tetrahymena thermophila SB210]EAS06811.2 hypothetical protein TTHERM_00901800 [Tetrahymena thermophila SB210]|eukprot:XP_001027053.2 hypothetical protein TTHERM_00901800 [Tetrahymena thermophila SB210]
MSYDDISTCQNQCQKYEVIDSEGKRCIKCKVNGCVQCTSQQICLACDQNLVLDKYNNQCNAKKGVCESDLQFLNPPFESRKCTNNCQQSYYQNYSSQICEYTQECPQIQQLSSFVMNTFVNGIAIFKENQYIVISGSSCSFAVVDQNWNIITIQTLQEINAYSFFDRQDETYISTFFSGIYGGILQGQRFNVMNFETLQIEFDEQNLGQEYNISYVDDVFQLVFMTNFQESDLKWYDIQNKKINTIQLQIREIIQLKILSRYYFQSKLVNQLFVGTLQQDFSISLRQSKKSFSDIPENILLQKDNYIISSKIHEISVNFKQINKKYPKYEVIGFMVQQDEIQILLRISIQYAFNFGIYNDCVRVKYNLIKNDFLFEFLNPYQSLSQSSYKQVKYNLLTEQPLKKSKNFDNDLIIFFSVRHTTGNQSQLLWQVQYLANQRIFANLTNIQGSFIVVQDNFLVILNLQDQSLYQLDLVTASLTQIFSFSPSQNFENFMFIDRDKKLPVIFDGDLIYLKSAGNLFQPFSISSRTLKYQLVNLGIFYTNFFLTSQITKEIFAIGFNDILAYSFDLQNFDRVQSGFFITDFFYDDKSIYFCEFDIFYKFDLLTKQLLNLTTTSTSIKNQPIDQKINYYRLDDTRYYKKSENVIDSQNMIIIKTQQVDNIYIGQTQYDDSQIHFFQSQNEFYWHKNLFNSPYHILYLIPQSQIFLAQQFDNDQNWIAIYDKSSNQITIYNSTDVFKVINLNFQLWSDIKYASSKILQLHQPAKIPSTLQTCQILVKFKQI